ncbi:very low-density lipoprotein receptor-like isoform X2 [Xenia sp. Carnegie-2017]|uniref:very low-density lipoprotein receptor-like isoform X2 n=1 Tax=Xenia sp. Carnegie-2017 TaxID=2897299 RepID=UPI001F046778|nr:very low-density lipoprotein receptor-like isoform X2 [Xenia sp. Carnegie-2017]
MCKYNFVLTCFFLVSLAIVSSVWGRKEFSCSENEFMCNISQTCTHLRWKCDGEDDCTNGEDELNCPPTTCLPDHYQCRSGRCIPNSWICDGSKDCPDEDDEAPKRQCNGSSCRSDGFQCRNGDCIKKVYQCDREHDCDDKSDEIDCPDLVCLSTEFKCANNLTCIAQEMKCNGVKNCADNSDEKDCACNPVNQLTCPNGICIPLSFQCDGDEDCSNGTDEIGCPPAPSKPSCPQHKFQCSNGECIPEDWRCDGEVDCNDDSDELNCSLNCSSNQFTCTESGKCISKDFRCDDVKNCDDGSDEINCEPLTLCTAVSDSSFRCGTTSYCINESKVCNHLKDCPGGEDEAFNCDVNECKEVYGSCSQLCQNLKGNFKCSCVEGYFRELGVNHETCRATGSEPYLLFGAESTVHNLTISARHFGNVVVNLKAPSAIAYDLKDGYVYWSDALSENIQRAQLHRKELVETLVDEAVQCKGIAIDWIGRKIYWSDQFSGYIQVSDLNGGNSSKLFNCSPNIPRGIAVDPYAGYLFWTSYDGSHPKIERGSMDGDPFSRITLLDTNIEMPTAITVDTITKRLFYVETKMRRIETITYEGRGRKMLISNGLIHPLGLALFEDRLYYTDFSLNTIFVANKRTGKSVGILKDSLRRPTGLSIVHPLLQKQVLPNVA